MASTTTRNEAPDTLATDRLARGTLALLRIGLGVLWLSNAGWKVPPDFGEGSGGGLFRFTSYAVDYPVFPPYEWLTRELILPNFEAFGWTVFAVEAAVGAFLILGLGTRFWALVGLAQSVAISLSVLYAPNEWPWAYYLMVLAHLAVFGAAAGRAVGLDGILRPVWAARRSAVDRAMLVAS